MPARYDTIGRRYSDYRHAEPTWEAEIWAALGPAGSVLNVGAGPGNYEPIDRRVVAVEPSAVMVEQRDATAAPVIRGVAESLPFADDSFDAVMGVLTAHHWSDCDAGLRELKRVAPRQVLTVFVTRKAHKFWLVDYFPQAAAVPTEKHAPTPESVGTVLDVREVRTLWVPRNCHEGFAAAHWDRPEMYLDPDAQGAISVLALLDQPDRERGSARLRADLDSGRWHERYGHLLDNERMDFGYRLIIAGDGAVGMG